MNKKHRYFRLLYPFVFVFFCLVHIFVSSYTWVRYCTTILTAYLKLHGIRHARNPGGGAHCTNTMSIWNSNKQLYVLPCLLRSAFSEFLDQSKLLFFFYFISSSLFSVCFRILLLYAVLPRHVSCKCGGHFWSRVEKTIAETGIGFRNFEMEADSHVPNRVFRNSKHKVCTSLTRYSLKLYVFALRLINKRARQTFIMITALFYVVTHWVVVISCRNFGTSYRSHLEWPRKFWPLTLEDGPDRLSRNFARLTITRGVITQKNAVLICLAAEASNNANFFMFSSDWIKSSISPVFCSSLLNHNTTSDCN